MAPVIPKEFQSPPSVCQPSMDMEPPLPNEFQCQPPTVQICLEGVSWYQVDSTKSSHNDQMTADKPGNNGLLSSGNQRGKRMSASTIDIHSLDWTSGQSNEVTPEYRGHLSAWNGRERRRSVCTADIHSPDLSISSVTSGEETEMSQGSSSRKQSVMMTRQKSESPPPQSRPNQLTARDTKSRRKSVCAVLVAPPSPSKDLQRLANLHNISANSSSGSGSNGGLGHSSSNGSGHKNMMSSSHKSSNGGGGSSKSGGGLLSAGKRSDRRMSVCTAALPSPDLTMSQSRPAMSQFTPSIHNLQQASQGGSYVSLQGSLSMAGALSSTPSHSANTSHGSPAERRLSIHPSPKGGGSKGGESPGDSSRRLSTPPGNPTAATAGQVLASKKRQSIANGTVIEVNLGNRSAFSPEDRRISIAGGSHETAGTEAQQKLSVSTSMHQLYISGLNTSSTDVRGEGSIRSGHSDIRTLYAANNVTYPVDSISINLVNAPDNSTVQCDCGHINCPLCNLMMNLELSNVGI